VAGEDAPVAVERHEVEALSRLGDVDAD